MKTKPVSVLADQLAAYQQEPYIKAAHWTTLSISKRYCIE
jgi:hypothetical protein